MSASSPAHPWFRSWQAATAAAAMTLALLVALPAAASADPGDEELPAVPCPVFDGPPAADDELTAYQYALACGVNVEVMGLRDVDRQVFATPTGLMDAQVAVEPYWVKNAAGAWVDIDPSFVAQANGSGVSAATIIGITAGAGGQNTFVTATDPGRGSLSLTWPLGALPAPVFSGSVATYPEVRPGVDLAVQAEAVGFSWVLVLKTPEAADDPILKEIAIGITTDGLSVVEDPETGRIDVVDDAGEVVFEAGQGIMWDSTPPAGQTTLAATTRAATAAAGGDPGQIGDVAVDVTKTGITLKPDVQMLADSSLTFPVYIDPPFTSTRKAWANVYAGAPSKGWTGDTSWPRSGGMRVGYNTWSDCGDGCGLWRSVITLNIGKLKGKYIDKAAVKALQTHTGGCGTYGLQLWRTKQISNGVSWNGVDWLYGSQLQTKDVPSSNASGGCSGTTNEWVSFDGSNVKKRVQSAADENNATISFGLRSSSEGDRNAWRRIQTKSVRLEVTYYIYPPKPDRLTIDGDGCVPSTAATQWVVSRKPTIGLRARASESESVYTRIRVRKQGSDTDLYAYRTPDAVAAYSPVSWPLTSSLADGAYTYAARSEARQSSAINSGWTDPCYFTVDATVPTKPTVSAAPAAPYAEGSTVTLTLASSDPVVNGVSSGLRAYEYSWNTPTYDLSAASTSPTITRVASAGRHVLYVRAVDNAGNRSMERTYSFFVGNDVVAFPKGMWRFEGDTYDDAGLSTSALSTAAGTRAFGADHDGRPNAALELDGSSCLTGTAPVRTDAAFSVSLWVRVDSAPTPYTKILSQGNSLHSAFEIEYDATDNRFYFLLAKTGAAAYTQQGISANNPLPLGQWVHLFATFDPDAGVQRLIASDGGAGVGAQRPIDFTPWNGASTFGVGCLRTSAGTTSNYLDGAIDGLGIWQGVLPNGGNHLAKTDLPEAAQLARWEFRNGGTDSSRYGRTLTIPAGVTVGFDRFQRPQGAVVLDGRSCLESPALAMPVEKSWSAATWVKADTTNTGTLLSTVNDAYDAGFELQTRSAGSGAVQFGLSYFTADHTQYLARFGNVLPGTWHHVAVSYDATMRTRSFYVDGTLASEITLARMAPTTAGLLIGCGKSVSNGTTVRSGHFQGSLQDVRLWRGPIDAEDLTSMMGYPPAELTGRWRLSGGVGTDTSGKSHNVVLEGQTRSTDGAKCEPDNALELSGSGSAATAGPVFATDDSFTVSAWVRLTTLAVDQTVVSAAGQQATGMRLRFSASEQKFGFLMMNADTADTTWRTLYGGPVPVVGTWYHLVGVYDIAAAQMRFYVSGSLVGTKAGPTSPWNATGPLVIGATGLAAGTRSQRLQGAIDDVLVWQGVLPAHVIEQISPAAPIPMCVD
ncbi:LamG-like jellyroll fold domain-containing protein [Hamadaea sp. NPDC051192]|uniref:LamG domain-containing protein n=1 Tax=Hamadaea sp. NPDC051192 TaxID=3154940 RepID=UPI0034227BF0